MELVDIGRPSNRVLRGGSAFSSHSYSEDLRRRIVSRVEGGLSKTAAARLFDVSLSSVKRYSKIFERGGSLEPRRGGRRPPKTGSTTRRLLEEDAQRRPWATVRERRSFLEGVTGESLSESTMRRLLHGLDFSQKTECGCE